MRIMLWVTGSLLLSSGLVITTVGSLAVLCESHFFERQSENAEIGILYSKYAANGECLC